MERNERNPIKDIHDFLMNFVTGGDGDPLDIPSECEEPMAFTQSWEAARSALDILAAPKEAALREALTGALSAINTAVDFVSEERERREEGETDLEKPSMYYTDAVYAQARLEIARERLAALSEGSAPAVSADAPTHPAEDMDAGEAFRQSMRPRADAYDGAAPLWYGWVIMDAFLAGAKHGRKTPAVSHAQLVAALRGLLTHPGIADMAPEDKDPEDLALERAAYDALSLAEQPGEVKP